MFDQDFIDLINILSFVIGWKNLEENVDQSTLDEEMKNAVQVIQKHLEEQDKKIEMILERMDNYGKCNHSCGRDGRRS